MEDGDITWYNINKSAENHQKLRMSRLDMADMGLSNILYLLAGFHPLNISMKKHWGNIQKDVENHGKPWKTPGFLLGTSST